MAKLFFGGDVINKFCDSQFIDESLQKIIKECDYAICNLEGVIRQESAATKGVYQHPSTIHSLKQAGFTLLQMSNNHIADWGKTAFLDTISSIRQSKLSFVGVGCNYDEVYKPFVVTIREASYCFINICEAQAGYFYKHNQDFGYAWMGDDNVKDRIRESSLLYDYTIVLVHAGLEHYDLPLVSFRGIYRGYCDAGADCVIASHPHISQGIEHYGKKLIFYSLGNFFFPRDPEATDSNPENLSYSIIVDFSKDGINYSPVFHKTNKCIVSIDESERAKVRLDKLCKILKSPEYAEQERIQVEHAYNSVVDTLFREALNSCSSKDRLKTKCHNIVKYILFRDDKETEIMKQKTLLRLFENESYRYLILECLHNKIIKQ